MRLTDAMCLLLPAFQGWTYARGRPSYPWAIPGVPGLHVGSPRCSNCCTFVEALVVGAAARTRPGFAWGLDRHSQMMVADMAHPFSPVDALIASGLAEDCDDETPAPWTVIQWWSSDWKSGHTLLVVDYDSTTDRALILESTRTAIQDGVSWRGLGALGARPLPDGWPTDPRLPKWERLTLDRPHWMGAILRS